jgi:hypothetical protein
MARRKKRRRDTYLAAARRQQLRDELPPGVSLDVVGNLCRFLDPLLPTSTKFGCRGETHSLSGAVNWIFNSEFYGQEREILAWLGALGGGCDCTIRTKALPRIIRLSKDLWE